MSTLISVAVITYNSSNTIEETLNSVLGATKFCNNIELIISDDGSSDDTIEIVNKWLSLYKSSFGNSIVVADGINRGTSANCNRAISHAKGEWIKIIAGDDILMPYSLDILIEYMNKYPKSRWFFGKSKFYKDYFNSENRLLLEEERYYGERFNKIIKSTAIDQLQELKKRNFFLGPGHLIQRSLLSEVGGFDEKFGILEDYPLWLKFLSEGERATYIDEFIAGYRVSYNGVCGSQTRLFNYKLEQLKYKVKRNYPLIFTKRDIINAKLHLIVSSVFNYLGLNKNSSLLSTAYTSINYMLDKII